MIFKLRTIHASAILLAEIIEFNESLDQFRKISIIPHVRTSKYFLLKNTMLVETKTIKYAGSHLFSLHTLQPYGDQRLTFVRMRNDKLLSSDLDYNGLNGPFHIYMWFNDFGSVCILIIYFLLHNVVNVARRQVEFNVIPGYTPFMD